MAKKQETFKKAGGKQISTTSAPKVSPDSYQGDYKSDGCSLGGKKG